MSYGFKVKTTGGQATVESVYGDLPDGEFDVTGHAGPSDVQVSITQRDTAGRYVTAAQHHHQLGQ